VIVASGRAPRPAAPPTYAHVEALSQGGATGLPWVRALERTLPRQRCPESRFCVLLLPHTCVSRRSRRATPTCYIKVYSSAPPAPSNAGEGLRCVDLGPPALRVRSCASSGQRRLNRHVDKAACLRLLHAVPHAARPLTRMPHPRPLHARPNTRVCVPSWMSGSGIHAGAALDHIGLVAK